LRVIALLATYNERRFIAQCLEHLHEQGVDTYLIDNCSTDDTVAIAERYLGRGLIAIESFPREEGFALRSQLERKEQLARELPADWFIHLDADEIRLPPAGGRSLAEALAAVDRDGYDAVGFMEFTFVPTRESPDHDHPRFRQTLRTYYPFAPRPVHQLKAWKGPEVELASSGGHLASFPNLRMWPEPFPMKHYLFLSVPHAIEKYVERDYDAEEVASGWHGWRASLAAAAIALPSAGELRQARTDADLDASQPWTRHYMDR
jgi:glycosyltransferase involved in cell wall biosynthesis